MKKILITLIGIWATSQTYGQFAFFSQSFEVNNIKTQVSTLPVLFWNLQESVYEVPKNSGKKTVFASGLWLGGVSNGELHLAAETYRQSGTDFREGPVSSSYPDSIDWSYYRLWTFTKDQIEAFKQDFKNGTVDYNKYPGIPSWPAHGLMSKGQAVQLAPFVDVNNDGKYIPAQGDYPLIKGDKCVYFIFNDDVLHTETQGKAMKAEIHRMVYAFKGKNNHMDNTLFVDYTVYNRSIKTYDSTIAGIWTDFDLGQYADDYVGTDVSRNMVYGYNGDSDDEGPTGYRLTPPAQGVILLNQQLGGSMYYENDFTVYGNPTQPDHYWNYLNGTWKDDAPKTKGGRGYGGTEITKYSFDGDPCTNTGWWEGNALNTPGDRRILAAGNVFNFKPGDAYKMTVAYVYARATSGDHISSLCELKNAADAVKSYYELNKHDFFPTALSELKLDEKDVTLYPNPATDMATIKVANAGMIEVSILDISGKIIAQQHATDEVVFNTASISNGLYFVNIKTDKGSISKKLIIE